MIQSIIRAMNIIELLAENPNKEMTPSEIADKLGIDHGTCSNIIKTLASRGYVQQSAPRKGYKFGYIFYKLTNSAIVNEDLTKIARPDVEDLGRKTNECAILSIIKNDTRIVLYHTTPNRTLIAKPNIDKSIYATNTGRVIIAHYTPNHLEKFIIRNGMPSREEWPAIYESHDPSLEFRRQLYRIKELGYEIYRDSSGIAAIAAPLWRDGHIAGSVGVYMPEIRFEDEDSVLQTILSTARSINEKLALTDKI